MQRLALFRLDESVPLRTGPANLPFPLRGLCELGPAGGIGATLLADAKRQ